MRRVLLGYKFSKVDFPRLCGFWKLCIPDLSINVMCTAWVEEEKTNLPAPSLSCGFRYAKKNGQSYVERVI